MLLRNFFALGPFFACFCENFLRNHIKNPPPKEEFYIKTPLRTKYLLTPPPPHKEEKHINPPKDRKNLTP